MVVTFLLNENLELLIFMVLMFCDSTAYKLNLLIYIIILITLILIIVNYSLLNVDPYSSLNNPSLLLNLIVDDTHDGDKYHIQLLQTTNYQVLVMGLMMHLKWYLSRGNYQLPILILNTYLLVIYK
jgi:hypothetical protein